MTVLDRRHDELLNSIEDLELLSLRWGDAAASLSRDTILDLATTHFAADTEDAVEALLEAGLVQAFNPPGGGERYRSRFAETIRLLARLRQTFPGEAWQGAPPLVADFRIDLRKRRYPARELDAADVMQELGPLSDLQRHIWRALSPTRLAQFQKRAAQRLLVSNDRDAGVIVGAGTGSGKTLAFYLPVFLRLAESVQPGDFWTKAIAIYPRNELLKDQLSEALRNASAVSPALRAAGRRPMRIGPYFGDTPQAASEQSVGGKWKATRNGAGFICPFLRCECGGDMIWAREDLAAGRERLVCLRNCGYETNPEILVLTRNRQRREPPDFLFTTTEMLNRSLSDQTSRVVFGVRAPPGRRPEFLLLDEAHTYTGVSGAQAALTLRRWRHLVGGPVTWAGLSATLSDAARFFAELTGVDVASVTEVVPLEDELEEEGREYQVVLRSDPAARTTVLSASIQTAMLLGRIMDPSVAPSQGRYGRRIFAFTDDLDVTHRLFHDFRDAEAYDRFGRPDPGRQPLAVLRAQILPGQAETDAERRLRDADGQRWRLPETLGRNLADRLRVGRTTSRDPGVDVAADIIVATAALEVGFNDRTVGAVLQHKAPRDYAAFLQRRGRAGRDRMMRPLTVTVLSDQGRDRSLFQAVEHLFDPTLAAQALPVRNEYVLRMQAVFSLLDWLADQPRQAPAGSVWRTVAAPKSPTWDDQALRDHIVRLLGEILREDGPERRALRQHLLNALRVEELTVDRLLWEAPRSILLEVAPTLLRRLFRNWNLAWPTQGHERDRFTPDHPLPDFAPRALFSDLNLPELDIVLPPSRNGEPDTLESMPLQQGLAQLAPGRVTRRFGDDYGGLSHWSAVPAGVTDWNLPIASYAEASQPLGVRRGEGGAGFIEANVHRPWRIHLDRARPEVIGVTSNSQLTWASAFAARGAPVEIATPARTAWRTFVRGADIQLHRFRASVEVTRFATGARADLRRPAGVQQVVDIHFRDADDTTAAVGFEFETDGLALHLTLPPPDNLQAAPIEDTIRRGLRAALHKRLVNEDPLLDRDQNVFSRAWLRQIHLLVCARRALERNEPLVAAADAVSAAGMFADYAATLDAVLGVQRRDAHTNAGSDEDDAGGSGGGAHGPTGRGRPRRDRLERLKAGLRDELAKDNVRARLHAALLEALDDTSPRLGDYMRRALQGTLAEGLMAAAVAATPRQASAEALLVDIANDEHQPGHSTIWLTESTVGGAGVLQALTDRFAAEPRLIFRGIEAALEPSDLDVAASALTRTYRLAAENPDVAAAVAGVRAEVDHRPRAAARARLLSQLEGCGVETSRAFVVSLSARMLAPGLGVAHDAVVRRLLSFWTNVEVGLGLEFDLREIAVLAVGDIDANELGLQAGIFTDATDAATRAAVFASLLWPRAASLHRQSLTSWNPYRAPLPCEPALVRSLLFEGARAAVPLDEDNWWNRLTELLAIDGAATLSAPIPEQRRLGEALVRLQATPIHVGALSLYAVVERIAKDDARVWASLILREQV
ncbi:protein DpdJ [Acidisphaera rubrifaciens]|uniref:Helicase n=1 Tax=Acidisphaera rubrifaciens HS-AP3 TaxID=1231350 RepID=A0A0D6P2G2_9PROT|nr:protein DpdJ [Acidisphaera rubrifaciens]GAN75847.1 helicase [Acidisphaera rubrifaciens HS-AP3]